jgi:hypothetical protein
MGFASRVFSETSHLRGVSKSRLALVGLVAAAAAVALGYGLFESQSLLIASILAALFFAAFQLSIVFNYAMAQSRKRSLAHLQDELRPRLKVLGGRLRINSVNRERSFDLVIRNEGSEPIDNCSAAACSIRMTRFAKARGEQTLDISSLYDQEVPLVLAVPSRGGNSHAFSLRPREMQRIPVCSRLDGQRNPLQIHFATGSAEPLKQVPDFAFGEIGITIFGGRSELEERLHLSVRENGALEVSRAN